MPCYEKEVVDTAKSQIGYKETGNNITKYAAYIDKNYPTFYNGKKQGVAWCDIFVDYCVLVNSTNEAEALYVLCQPKMSAGAGCKYSYEYYKAKGRTGKEPKVGAQVFFSNFSHTGIVIEVTNDSIVTVEGNSGNAVKKHTYKKTSTKICGYGYPRYEAVVDDKYDFPTIPKRGFFANGDKGIEVRKMQKILLAIVPNCLPRYGADGEIGQETLHAIAQVQRKVGVTVDRLYGPKTNEACKKYLTK